MFLVFFAALFYQNIKNLSGARVLHDTSVAVSFRMMASKIFLKTIPVFSNNAFPIGASCITGHVRL